MVITRAFLLERIFTEQELLALDDHLPRWESIMKPKKNRSNTLGYLKPTMENGQTLLGSDKENSAA